MADAGDDADQVRPSEAAPFADAARCPYEDYASWRAEPGLTWSPSAGAYLVTRYADAVAVLADHARFSSSNSVFGGAAGAHPEFPSIINLDEPRHGELRAVVARSFAPAEVERRWSPIIRGRVRALLDAMPPDGFDAVADLATPLTTGVVGDLLGLPAGDLEELKRASDAVVSEMGRVWSGEERESSHARYERAVRSMSRYFLRAWRTRRRDPGDDLISMLASARVHGRRLRATEVYAYCTLLLISGCETTANLIAQVVWELATDPDLLAGVRSDPELAARLVDETARRESPVQAFYRRVRVDTELAGTALREGDALLVMFGAANRDEAHFDDAEALDVDRAPSRHLAFGHGIHHCMGAGLAGLEARIAIEEVAARFATLRVRPGSEPRRRSTPLLRGLAELQIEVGSRA